MLSVLPIKSSETYPWLLRKHYLKRIPNITNAFGLFRDNFMIGVVTYGKPASPWLCKGVAGDEYSPIVLELNRVCLSENVKNYASFLVSKSLSMLPKPRIIISYADTKMGHVGYIYQACNFIYTGLTPERTDVDTGEKHARHIDNLDYTKRKLRSAKHRYIFVCATKTEKKKIKRAIRYKKMPYPKGNTINYDAGGDVKTQGVLFNNL